MAGKLGAWTSALVAALLVIASASSAAEAASIPAVHDPHAQGYRLVAADGGVFSYGGASFRGSLGGTRLNAPIVGGTATSSGDGYWLLGRDGGVFAFGDAPFEGTVLPNAAGMTGGTGSYVAVDRSGETMAVGGAALLANGVRLGPALTLTAAPSHVTSPFVGIAGPWMATSDGGIFSYADASPLGTLRGTQLSSPIVGIVATPTNKGYWLVAADGGVFSFGDAGFFGNARAQHLNKPVVGMARTPSGNGYWLVAADGGVFSFGDAQFLGGQGGEPLNQPIVGILAP